MFLASNIDIPLLPDIVLILGLSVLVVLFSQKLKMPTILGFLLTGILAGPHALSLISNVADVEVLAEIGVILLLFTIGLEFSLSGLASIKKAVMIGGGLQVLFTTIAVWFLARQFGFSHPESVFLGFLFSLSSTAIVLKLLQSRGEIDSPHGRNILAVLIFQDIIVVPMMLFTPLLTGESQDLGYMLLILALKAIGVIGAVIILARYVVPKLLHLIARSKSKELFILSVVVICFAVAWMTASIGLSLALGAFLAGLIISESEYSHQAVGNILPFHEIFTSFFFVSIGMLLDTSFLIQNFGIVLLLVIATFLLKTLMASIAAYILNIPIRTVLMVGLGLAQVGEFSFILSGSGIESGILQAETYQYFLAVSILTMAATPFILNNSHNLTNFILKTPVPKGFRMRMARRELAGLGGKPRKSVLKDHLIIVGFGINGRNLARAASKTGIPYVILDLNADTIAREKHNFPIHYGDAVHAPVLEHFHIHQARVVVIAISDPVSTRRIIANIRSISNTVYIIVRTRYVQEMGQLIKLGANEVIPEEFETSVEIFTRVLSKYMVPRDEIENFVSEVRSDGYEMFRSRSGGKANIPDVINNLSGFDIVSIRIPEGSNAAGITLADAAVRSKYGVTILTIKDQEGVMHHPYPESTIDVGSILITFGEPAGISLFDKFIRE